ncbi:MAG: DUF4270 domain-containing protein [Prevotella sp.]|nr:DUF4270 domain-containing protein [Prevotella sp.]MBR5036291.1 DUF4270 domain-containing protein [Prevotella sp.]
MKFRYLVGVMLTMFILSSCDDTTNEIGSSLIHDMDNLDVSTDTFKVSSRTLVADSVYSRSTYGYLGSIRDPETGNVITGNFMTQFYTLEEYANAFPAIDSIASRLDGKIIADSCEIRLFFSNFYGDSLSTMKVTAHEMGKPMLENQRYYSNFDPKKEGYLRQGGIKKEKVYTLADQSVSKATRYSDSYTSNIRIPLNDAYTDKDGNQYNNYGSYIINSMYKDKSNFSDQLKFIKNVVPGFYFESTGGIGSMAYIFTSKLIVYFRVLSEDSVYNALIEFGGTEEVLQTTKIENNDAYLQTLAADNSCTYLKTPAGLFTELTLPVDDILRGHDTDSLSAAKLVIPRINDSSQSDYNLPAPSQLLLIPKDSLYTFFENNRIINNRTSYLASSPSTTGNNTYLYSNIATLISAMNKNRQSANWNKVVLVPVDVTTSSSIVVKVSHSMELSSTRLVGGSENPYKPIQISVLYGKFK